MQEHDSSNSEHLHVSPEIQEQMNAVLGKEAPPPGEDPLDTILQGVDPDVIKDNEDALENLIDKHPVAHELAVRLKDMRDGSSLSRDKEREYVANVIEVRKGIGNAILDKLGLEKPDVAEIARQKEAARIQALGNVLATLNGEETEDELLTKYGLTDIDGQLTEATIESPLFRSDTQTAFRKYMRFARNFDAMEKFEMQYGVGIKKAPEASNIRMEAHNTVARLVMRDLGLEFDKSRRFVAKMRDAIVPNSHEKDDYATVLRGQKIAERYHDDAAAFARAALSGLIEAPMNHEKQSS